MTEQRVRVSKLDAARRQLETAVRLYFNDEDPIAIHTLTAAAHQVLADISKARGSRTMIADQAIERLVRPEKRDDARRMLREAANFLKHADRDPDATLALLVSQSEFLLFDAVHQYRELTGQVVPILATYWLWWWLGPGKNLVDPDGAFGIDRFRRVFAGATKQTFLADALQMLAEQPPAGDASPGL